MKKLLKTILITGLKLFSICAVSAVVLGMLNFLTEPKIKANRIKQENLALAELTSKGKPGEKKAVKDETVDSYYEIMEDDQPVSYILNLNGSGYGGPGTLKIMANYTPDGGLLSARLLDNKETPGLGKKAENPAYMNKFLNRGGTDQPPIPTTLEELTRQMKQDTTRGTTQEKSSLQFANFFEWFFGKPKEGNQDSVTGATITFKGVGSVLAAGSTYVKSRLGVNND